MTAELPTKCARCGHERMVAVERFHHTQMFNPMPFFVGSMSSPKLLGGKLRAVFCASCGLTEWYASDFEEMLEREGEVFPDVQVVDHAFLRAVRELGLVEDAAAKAGGWKFLAMGQVEGVYVAVGEVARQRRVEDKWRMVMRIEVMAKTGADIGAFVARKTASLGVASEASKGVVVRSGDPEFDGVFQMTVPKPVSDEPEPVVDIPWLDESMRRGMIEVPQIEEMTATGFEVRLVLREFEAASFGQALETVNRVARWPGRSMHAYR